MSLLILASPANADAVEAALDAADPLGAPYRLTRQVSRASDAFLAYFGAHDGSADTARQQMLIDAVEGATGGVAVIVDGDAAASLAAVGVGHRWRPELPEDPPTRHADFDALDAERGITTTGTLADRWAQHEEDSRR